MRKNRYLMVVLLLTFLPVHPLLARQKEDGNSDKSVKSHVSLGADLVSRYVWRGQLLGGNAPAIQPYLTFQSGNFEAGIWSSFSLSGNNFSQETDLHISQSFVNKMFTVTLTDYFFPSDTSNYNYFQYSKDVTGHIFEGTIAFNGTEKFPLTILIATNFYGADAERMEEDPKSPQFNRKTGIQYSTYFELGYPFQFRGVEFNTFLGFNATTPRKANPAIGYKGEKGYYGDGFGVVNLGFTASKTLNITKQYALPVMVSFITNPQSGKIYFVFGISF